MAPLLAEQRFSATLSALFCGCYSENAQTRLRCDHHEEWRRPPTRTERSRDDRRPRMTLLSWLAMPAYYRGPLLEFVQLSPSAVVGQLALANAQARFPLSPESIEAWRAQLPPMLEAARYLIANASSACSWEMLLEYPIPRVGKRIDAVLLADNVIIVIETKTGNAPNSASRQVEDYALNLACFHQSSKNGTIVPLVVSDAKT